MDLTGLTKRTPALAALAFIAITFALYANIIRAPFILDDWAYLVENPLMKERGAPWVFWTSFKQVDYWPLSYSFLWLLFRTFGTATFGYHVVSILLHATNTFLVFSLLQKFRVRCAFVAALLFLVHPLQVESVAWIFQIKTLLSTCLCLLSWLCYFKSYEGSKGNKVSAILSLLLFALALLAKSAIAIFPLLLLLQIWIFEEQTFGKALRRSSGYFFIAALLVSLNLWVWGWESQRENWQWHPDFFERVLWIGQSLWIYLRGFFWADHLLWTYPKPISFAENPEAFAGWVFALVLLALGLLNTNKTFRLGVFVYFVGLIPVLGFVSIPYFRFSPAADHWQYFSIVGLSLALGPILNFLDDRVQLRAKAVVKFAAVTALIGGLAFKAYLRSQDFGSETQLLEKTMEQNPKSAFLWYSLGVVKFRDGNEAECFPIFQKAYDLAPLETLAVYNMAILHARRGEMPQAFRLLQETIDNFPGYLTAYEVFASLKEQAGFVDEAKSIWDKAESLGYPDLSIEKGRCEFYKKQSLQIPSECGKVGI